jgi:hypothetical protein
VDFVAAPIPVRVLNDVLPRDCYPVDNVTWLYRDSARQALILSRHDAGGELWLRYLPVRDLSQSSTGEIRVQIASPQQGFPLEVWEGLAMAESSRDAWLNSWHREFEWFEAMHATRYSNGLIDLVEVFAAPAEISDRPGTAADDALVSRFRHRQRNLVRADFIVFANDHWNFNYRGFNPGGNHGAFFRKSTHATLMFAGGRETGIPEGLAIERPYDALSVAPTLFTLTGELNGQGLSRNLVNRGFKPFPGPVIRELFTSVP